MFLVSRWSQAATAAERLKAYGPHFGSYIWTAVERRDAEEALTALGPNPHPDAVEKVWPGGASQTRCDECKVECDAVVCLGEEPDWESATARICAKCLLKAMMLIEP